jgi:hypothetical protein
MTLPTSETKIESIPRSTGAYPPAMEPITIPIMINFFLDMASANRVRVGLVSNLFLAHVSSISSAVILVPITKMSQAKTCALCLSLHF